MMNIFYTVPSQALKTKQPPFPIGWKKHAGETQPPSNVWKVRPFSLSKAQKKQDHAIKQLFSKYLPTTELEQEIKHAYFQI